MAVKHKRNPYGLSNFTKLRRDNRYYVDKTRCIRLLDESGDYHFFIRPRRPQHNTDMTLYFLDQVEQSGKMPEDMIDLNVCVDYGKLRHPVLVDQQLPTEGKLNGLLTYDHPSAGENVLRVPNRTVQTLMYGYLRSAFKDVNIFRLDVSRLANLVRAMAQEDVWEELFDFLAEEMDRQTVVMCRAKTAYFSSLAASSSIFLMQGYRI